MTLKFFFMKGNKKNCDNQLKEQVTQLHNVKLVIFVQKSDKQLSLPRLQ